MDTITGILALTALKSIRRRAAAPAPLVLATRTLQRGSL
jgi:hypothetical protein